MQPPSLISVVDIWRDVTGVASASAVAIDAVDAAVFELEVEG